MLTNENNVYEYKQLVVAVSLLMVPLCCLYCYNIEAPAHVPGLSCLNGDWGGLSGLRRFEIHSEC